MWERKVRCRTGRAAVSYSASVERPESVVDGAAGPATAGDGVAGDGRAPRRREERHDVGDLVRFDDPADGVARRVGEHRVGGAFGAGGPGVYDGHVDPLRPELVGEVLRHRGDRDVA